MAEFQPDTEWRRSGPGIDGRAVANFILDHCDQRRRPVTHLALQKLMYFCHAWTLVQLDAPLIKQRFEAWQYGPVLQYIYREFRKFGDSTIKERAKRINVETGRSEIVLYKFDPEILPLLVSVVDFYSRLRLGDLVELSHISGGPWDQVWNHAGQASAGMLISNEAIKTFYSTAPVPSKVQ